MTKTLTKAPFKAEQVGSLLRPENLLKARKDFKEGTITASELRIVETKEIKRIVDKQIEVGLEAVTDGEFRRSWWHYDFLENLNGIEAYTPDNGQHFQGIETEKHNVKNTGKIAFNSKHPFVKDFIEFKEIVGDRAVAKQTIPSPNQLFVGGIRNTDIYPDIEEFADDVIQAYREALKSFYDAGCRYLQFDDVYLARLSSPESPSLDGKYSRDQLIELALRVVNEVLEDKPEDLFVSTHVCRGNYQSTWAFEGSYAKIATTIFAKENVDSFFLEYDDDRSGSFEPLKHIPKGGAQVVIGAITSKFGELENKEAIKARIQEAANYVPLEQIALSPQCGFSSTHHGNKLSEEEQWDKLRFVVELSKEIWG